jgi:hypothetical protein
MAGITFSPGIASEIMAHTVDIAKDMFGVLYQNNNLLYGNIANLGTMNSYPINIVNLYDLKVNHIKNTKTFTLSIRVNGDINWTQLTPVVLGSTYDYNPKIDMCLYNSQPNEYIEYANYKINSGTYLYAD